MSRILRVLLFSLLAFGVQLMPAYNGANTVLVAESKADEAQDMIESAPPILQAAYDNDWKRVISIAKKNRNTLKDVDELGNTVLHIAAQRASDATIIELLKLGADKNAKDHTSDQTRPYYYAQRNKNLSAKVRNMLH
ncbi:ankyrin repeat domain-containing protein [Desulfovibrio piger]|nr:ankyrin repeat domain-containing protein [Desulfovibrio piger]